MSNLINYCPDPLYPGKDQEKILVDVTADTVVGDFLATLGLTLDAPVRLYVNTTEIPRTEWTIFHPAMNDIITVKADVAGDGVVPMLLTLALIAVAPPLGAAFAASAIGTTIGVSAAVATGVITVVGGLLINLLVDTATPEINSGNNISPSYNLSGAQNTSRIDKPIPIIIGKIKYVPDLAAQPFTSFRGEDNYMYVSYHFGMNTNVTISDLKVGNNPIDDFDDMDYRFSPGNTGTLEQFPGNVDESPGGSIERPKDESWNPAPIPPSTASSPNPGTDEPVTRTSSTDAVALEVDITATLVRYNKKGQARFHQAYMDIEYRPTSGGLWLPFLDTGKNVGIGNDSTKLLRKTYRREVPSDEYEVRITRTSNDDIEGSKQTSNITWEKLRTFQTDTADYTGQKRMSLTVRSSGQLNGIIQNLTGVVSAECEAWDGSNWVLTETQNPAWWYRYMALGRYNPNSGLLEFGAGKLDSDLDLDAIKSWGQWCDDNNLRIGMVFDSQLVVADALNQIARVGRASVSLGTGKLGVVVDEGNLPITQSLGMPDLIDNSFSVSFVSEEQADRIIVEFLNEDDDYALDQVKATVPGVSNPSKSVTVRIPGLINEAQAGEECLLLAAQNFYRRSIISFETDWLALNVQRGDVISVSHELTGWGESGRLVNTEENNVNTIHISHEVEFTDGPTGIYYLRLRHPDGIKDLVQVYYSDTPTRELNFYTPLSQDPSAYPNNDPHDAVWQFDASNNPGKRLKVLMIEPVGDNGSMVRLICNIDDDGYYEYGKNGVYDYDTIFRTFNQGVASVSQLGMVEELRSPEGPIDLHISWDMENARGARVSIKVHQEDDTDATDTGWDDLGDIEGKYTLYTLQNPGTITIRLTALPLDKAKMSANTIQETFLVQGIFLNDEIIPLLPQVSGLELTNTEEAGGNDNEFYGQDAKFVWRPIESEVPEIGAESLNIGNDYGSFQDSVFRDYQIEILDGDDGALRRRVFTLDSFFTYTWEMNKEDSELLGLPTSPAERDFTINVAQRGRQNQISIKAAMTVNNPAPPVPTGISTEPGLEFISINLIQPDTAEDTDYKGILIWMSENTGFIATGEDKDEGNCVYRGNGNAVVIGGLSTSTQYFIKVAGYDTFGKTPSELNLSSEFSETTSQAINEVGVDSVVFDGIVFTGNDPVTNDISWTAGNATWNDTVTTTVYAISAGSASWTGDLLYIYYQEGDSFLSVSSVPSVAVQASNRVLGTYDGGTLVSGNNGEAYLDGDLIYGGTILGNKIIAGTVTATELGADSVTADKVAANSIVGDSILAGSIAATDAVFQNGAIRTADIDTAQITTLLLDGQSVNIPISSFTRKRVYSYGGWTTCVSAVIQGTGNPKSIILSSHVGASKRKGNRYGHAQMRLLRNGVLIVDYGVIHTNSNNRHNLSFTTFVSNIVDNLSTGTYRYELQILQTGNAGPSSADNSAMTIIETKR